MSRDFNVWLSKFKTSIADYSYYVDFEKVYQNVESIKVELNILNSLVGEREIEKRFVELLNKYPETLKCIPILLAVRNKEIEAMGLDGKQYSFSFARRNLSIEMYCEFMRETGLFDLLQNHIISNLVDYVSGVETGLDSNGRKNRGGHLMEDVVERFIQLSGFVVNKNYFKEMYSYEVERKFNVNLDAITDNGTTDKRFDFVVKGNRKIYLIETNFYASSGSKLNETARSYKTLALEAKSIPNVEFVWFTDGIGWKSAKNNLKETFDITDYIFSIDELEKGIMKMIFV